MTLNIPDYLYVRFLFPLLLAPGRVMNGCFRRDLRESLLFFSVRSFLFFSIIPNKCGPQILIKLILISVTEGESMDNFESSDNSEILFKAQIEQNISKIDPFSASFLLSSQLTEVLMNSVRR